MLDLLKPIKTDSLKDVFVSRFEALILSGKLSIGQKLPSERELALQLGVSRPVVHEGLVDLASKGLITLKPRIGAIVNDYRKYGSPEILDSLFNYNNGKLDSNILRGILSMRILFEEETARLAAVNISDDQLKEFEILIEQEKALNHNEIERITQIDFDFHHLITMASGNFIYPLLLNSMKRIYTNLSGQFFRDTLVVPVVFAHHDEMLTALQNRDEDHAEAVMKKLLEHGERHLMRLIEENE
jgi:GntR family transcriptional regulator, transcriptional repressor for pyruvate dehydrogenase complex